MNQIKVACLLYCTTHAAQANGLVFFVQLIFYRLTSKTTTMTMLCLHTSGLNNIVANIRHSGSKIQPFSRLPQGDVFMTAHVSRELRRVHLLLPSFQ